MNDLKFTSTFDYLKNQKLDPAKTALLESWEHWRRMICWVEAQRDRDPAFLSHPADAAEMDGEIGERWNVKDCALCTIYFNLTGSQCKGCPLGEAFGRCVDADFEVENAFPLVEGSLTWKSWLEHANTLEGQIRSLMVAP